MHGLKSDESGGEFWGIPSRKLTPGLPRRRAYRIQIDFITLIYSVINTTAIYKILEALETLSHILSFNFLGFL